MAQVVKLKRTSVQGRIPNISNLELGELAINTYDGRIFFEKDNGELSIQEILTTNSQNSGSFNLTGAISASSLSIDGNAIIGGSITSTNFTINDTLTAPTITGSLLRLSENGAGLRMTNVGAFDNSSGNFRIFATQDLILATNGENGTAVTIDQTTKDTNFVGAVTASYFVGDGSGITNLQVSSSIVEATTVTSSFDNESTISIIHSFDSKNIIVSVYDTDYSQIIPQSVTLTDNDTVDIVLSNTGSGHVVVANGGHIVRGVYVDEVTKVSDSFTNQTSYTINHSFGTKDVIVTTYNTSDEQILPQLVSTPTTSSVEIGFENPTSGRVVVVKGGHLVSGSIPFENISNKPDLISGSVTGSNIVGSDTVTSIETMTSAAYAQITPVTGTLYIITD